MHFSLLEAQLAKEGLMATFERPVVSFKTLHTDFVVREMSPLYKNGAPLVLEPLPTAEPKRDDAAKPAKRQRGATEGESAEASAQEAELLEALLVRVQDGFAPLISAEELELLAASLRSGMGSVIIRGEMTKAHRTLVHGAVKEFLGSTHISRTESECIIIEKATPAMRREAVRRSNPLCTRKFLHFTLYKENMDSNQAMRAIATFLGISVRQLLFSGTKDKRAVTLQRVAIRGLSPEKLYGINKKSFGPESKVKVCSFKEMDVGLRLGDTVGNHFLVALRLPPGNTGIPSKMLQTIQEVISHTGVVNYYGPQRFGTSEVLTSDVGVHLLAGDFEKALRLIFQSKTSRAPHLVSVSEAFERRDFNEAHRLLPRHCFQERDILNHLMQFPNDFMGAFQKIPRTLGMLYCHAVQSLVWNLMASKRLALHREPIVGDLVLKSHYACVRQCGACSNDEKENGNNREDMGSPKAEGLPEVVRLTMEDVESGLFRLTDILLTVPGPDEQLQYPDIPDCSRSAYVAALASMEAEGLMRPDNALTKVFHFHGAYRSLVVQPKGFKMRLVPTAGSHAPVIPTDLELLGENSTVIASQGEGTGLLPNGGPSSSCEAIVVEFSLPPGSYATCVLREFSVCRMEDYHIAAVSNVDDEHSLDAESDAAE